MFDENLNKIGIVLIKGIEILLILSPSSETDAAENKSKEICFPSPYKILNFLQNTPTLHSFLEKRTKGGKISEIIQL